MRRHASRWIVCACAATLAFGVTVEAQRPVPTPPLVITAAVPDTVNQQLEILGHNFGTTPGRVTLNEVELAVLQWADGQIVALSPPTWPGSYLLTVSRGYGNLQTDRFAVTITDDSSAVSVPGSENE